MNIGATYEAVNLFGEDVKGILLPNQIGGTPVLRDSNNNLHPVHKGTLKLVKTEDKELSYLYVTPNGLSGILDGTERKIIGIFSNIFGQSFVATNVEG